MDASIASMKSLSLNQSSSDKKNFGLTRNILDFSSSASNSFHASLTTNKSSNKSSNNLSLNLSNSSKTSPHSSKTPDSSKSKSTSKSESRTRLTKPLPRRPTVADRFIADRSSFDMAHYLLRKKEGASGVTAARVPGDPPPAVIDGYGRQLQSSYSRYLTENLLGVSELASSRVLNFDQRPRSPQDAYDNVLKVLYQDSFGSHTNFITKTRVVPLTPDRVLDAPNILDDFYLNVMDWSKQNVLGVGLTHLVYLWNAYNAAITKIPVENQREDGPKKRYEVGCVTWIQDGIQLGCTLEVGDIQIWDVNQVKLLRTLTNGDLNCRIPAVSLNSHLLSEGNRLGHIRHHDLRIKAHQICSIQKAHDKEICGLKWSHDGRYLASGGNDHVLNIWDSRNMTNNAKPICTFDRHLAAVKALSWSPCQYNILASGGGTRDSTIKLWNVSAGSFLTSVKTGSQVSGLLWSEDYREVLSSHGRNKYQLSCWKYPNMAKVGELRGHADRILHMSLSPDETTVATVGADETLRFWKVYPSIKSSKNVGISKAPLLSGLLAIR